MGTLVLADDRSNTKPNYAVTSPAAAAVVVADTEMAVFVGASIQTQLEAFNGLDQCKHALRDAGWPNPITSELSAAVYDTVTNVLTVTNGAAPTLAEDDVAILVGLDFTPAAVSNSTHATRMAEVWLEDVAKAA